MLGNCGCVGLFWGYGWDVWNVDFFVSGGLLFVVVFWIVVCGNYENCFCVGQGWWCFIDLCLLLSGWDCNCVEDDVMGDVVMVYVVFIGDGVCVIVVDLVMLLDKLIDFLDFCFV